MATPLNGLDELLEETVAWCAEQGMETLEDVAAYSVAELEALPDFVDDFLWELEHALDQYGLSLEGASAPDPRLGLLSLDEWLARLRQHMPGLSELSREDVLAMLRQRGVSEETIAKLNMAPPSYYDTVFIVLARNHDWLYYDDWRGSREEAARAFERGLGLAEGTVRVPDGESWLSDIADLANEAAEKLGETEARWLYLAPYDDECVFALLTPAQRKALMAERVLQPISLDDYRARGEQPLELDPSTELERVGAFANSALNLFQSLGLLTVADLLTKSAQDLRRLRSELGTVEHIEGVLKRAGLCLRHF